MKAWMMGVACLYLGGSEEMLSTGMAQAPAVVDAQASPRNAEVSKVPIGGEVAKEASRKLLQSGMPLKVDEPVPDVPMQGVDMDAGNDLTPQQRAKLIEAPLRRIMYAELYFLDQACRLDRNQRRPLREAGERGVLNAAKKYSEDGDDGNTNVREMIQREISKSAALRPEQAVRYQAEVTRRNDHQSRAIVRMLVARLDRTLLLSADQRVKLSDRLFEELKDNWMRMEFVWTLDAGSFPKLSRRAVAPILNRQQKKVWSSLAKVEGGGGFSIEDTGMDHLPWEVKDEVPLK